MVGRPQKPLALHAIDGTLRKDRHAKRGQELTLAPGSIGECPDWVSPEAKEEWNRLLGTEWAKILAPSHRTVFLRYCILWGREQRTERQLPRWCDGYPHPDPSIVETMGSQEPNLLHQLMQQLGLTPLSQTRLVVPKSDSPKNKWTELG